MKTTLALCALTLLSLSGSTFAAIAADSGKARNVRQYAPGMPAGVDQFGNLQMPGMAVPLDAYGNPAGAHVDAYGNPVHWMPPPQQQPQTVIVQQQEQKPPQSPFGSGGSHGAWGGLFQTFFG